MISPAAIMWRLYDADGNNKVRGDFWQSDVFVIKCAIFAIKRVIFDICGFGSNFVLYLEYLT